MKPPLTKIERAARLTRKVRKPIARPTRPIETQVSRAERRRIRRQAELLDEENQ